MTTESKRHQNTVTEKEDVIPAATCVHLAHKAGIKTYYRSCTEPTNLYFENFVRAIILDAAAIAEGEGKKIITPEHIAYAAKNVYQTVLSDQ
jgi:histone H3/H4